MPNIDEFPGGFPRFVASDEVPRMPLAQASRYSCDPG